MGIQEEQREEHSEGQENPLLQEWEYMVILTLGSLNLILISIIVVLAKRHRNLRRRLKLQQPRYNPSHEILIPDTFLPAIFPGA